MAVIKSWDSTNQLRVNANSCGQLTLYDSTGAVVTSANPLPVSIPGSISGTVTANQGTAGAAAWKVDGSAVTQPISGSVTANLGSLNGAATDSSLTQFQGSAGGGTVAYRSVLVGGIYSASLPNLASGQQSGMLIDSNARLIVGSIASALPVGSNTIGNVNQAGTWTVQPGNTANTTPWLASINAGGNTATVKAASTVPVASDPALVVSMSPNAGMATSALQTSAIGVLNTIATNTGASSVDFTATGSITAVGNTVAVYGQGVYSITASITGTWVGTLVAEGQLADSTWVQIPMYPVSTTMSGASVGATTTNGTFLVIGGGYLQVRIRASAWTSGSAAVALDGSLSQQATFAAQLGVWMARMQDGAGNALASSTTYPVGTEQGLIVRPVGANIDGQKASYSASIVGLAPAATGPTDVLTISGSASKTVRVTRVVVAGTQTTAAVRDLLLIKRSTANTGGTSAALTAVPHDSANAAATASVLSYTANPSALGTAVGTVRAQKALVGSATATSAIDDVVWDFGNRPSQAVVLRGTAQVLALNLNAVASTGAALDVYIEWTEE